MPAVVRLGTAEPPLSLWLGAAPPEEIKKCPGVVVTADGDEFCLSSENTGERKTTLKNLPKGLQKKDFLFLGDLRRHWTVEVLKTISMTPDNVTCYFKYRKAASIVYFSNTQTMCLTLMRLDFWLQESAGAR